MVMWVLVSLEGPVYAKQGSAPLLLVFRHHKQKQTCPHKQPWRDGNEKSFALMTHPLIFFSFLYFFF